MEELVLERIFYHLGIVIINHFMVCYKYVLWGMNNDKGEVRMFGRKKKATPENNDNILLKEAMDRIIAGDFSTVPLDGFTDTEYPEKLNQVVLAVKRFNNNFIMRLNESMQAIGDNSYVKNMLDQVTSQTKDIEDMGVSGRNMEQSIDNISSYMNEIRNNIHEILATSQNSTANMNESIKAVNESSEQISKINVQLQAFQAKIDEIGKIVDVVRDVASQSNLLALNASIEAARAGEAGRGFAVVAEQVRDLSNNTSQSASDIVKYVHELQEDIGVLAQSMDETTEKLSAGNGKVEASLADIEHMNDQISVINDSANGIMEDIDRQSDITKAFSNQLQNITESYGILSELCRENGIHFYKIGRYIDTCRSDMFRKAGCLTPQDRLKVFEVDHFILMWRVYSHALEFEQLRLNQVNNPDKCKIGLWMAEQTDPRITGSTQFKELDKAHLTVHKYATESWYAKDRGDVETALAFFQKCYDAYFVYQKKIHALMDYMDSIGYTERTEIIIFQK